MSIRRSWFRDDDGTYYRNCNLIMAERRTAVANPLLWWRLPSLEREWRTAWRKGVLRKAKLGWFDRVVQPTPFREAYPDHPILWKLDDH